MNLLETSQTQDTPETFLAKIAEIRARFDETTQDSGNVSYGIEIAGVAKGDEVAGNGTGITFLKEHS